jgi:cytochrome c oxidase subunit II
MPLPRSRRWLWLAVILGLLMGLVPAVANAQPPSPLAPSSPGADSISNLFWIIFWMGAAIYVLVQFLIIFAALKYRRKNDDIPRQFHGNTRLELGWTIAPAIVLLVILYFTVQTLNVTRFAGQSTLDIDVIGHQWWWEYRYPQQDIVTASDLVVPVNTPIRLRIWSDDVIHSFWIPQLNGKTDANPINLTAEGLPAPGNVRPLNNWFTATEVGTFEGQCTEYCGEQHAVMRMRVKAVSQADWEAWVRRNSQPAQPAATAAQIERGKQVFLTDTNLCVTCHAIKGTTAVAVVGPNLSNIGGRDELGAGALPNSPENLRQWIRNAPSIKSGIEMPAMPNLTEADLDALVAYLWSLK